MNKILIDFRREPGITKARDIQDEINAMSFQKIIDTAKDTQKLIDRKAVNNGS